MTIKKFIVKETRKSSKKAEVDFMIDSGAVYSLVPGKVLRKLGISPYREMEFLLADGTKITRHVGDAYFEYNGEGGSAPVIFGEKGDEPLLGATTLESIGLVLNPFKRELYPMRMILAKLSENSRPETTLAQVLGPLRVHRISYLYKVGITIKKFIVKETSNLPKRRRSIS